MLLDLERLIQLQELDNAVAQARQDLMTIPARLETLDARLAARDEAVVSARLRLTENHATRRALEKDLAVAQSRLSRFKDQLMEVKTNKEYQAMQKEIATAEHDVRTLEDQILERLLEADELAAAVKQAEAELLAEQAAAAREREATEEERVALERQVAESTEVRREMAAPLDPAVLGLFETVARLRKGIAVAEARDGHCSLCHVRLRPQVYNDIRRNESLIQCDSCQRILFFASTSWADAESQD